MNWDFVFALGFAAWSVGDWVWCLALGGGGGAGWFTKITQLALEITHNMVWKHMVRILPSLGNLVLSWKQPRHYARASFCSILEPWLMLLAFRLLNGHIAISSLRNQDADCTWWKVSWRDLWSIYSKPGQIEDFEQPASSLPDQSKVWNCCSWAGLQVEDVAW